MLASTAHVLLATGCSSSGPTPDVRQYGPVRTVLGGDLRPRASVAQVAALPGAIAVGAMSDFRGQVTIHEGEAWIARVDDGRLRIAGPVADSHAMATMLTVAQVADWRTIPLQQRRITHGADLEALVEQAARRRGIAIGTAFPFVIEGVARSFEIRVSDGLPPEFATPGVTTVEPWRRVTEGPIDVTIVGFHARNGAGVITHRGSTVHAHVLFELGGRRVTAHLDEIEMEPGATLRLPSTD